MHTDSQMGGRRLENVYKIRGCFIILATLGYKTHFRIRPVQKSQIRRRSDQNMDLICQFMRYLNVKEVLSLLSFSFLSFLLILLVSQVLRLGSARGNAVPYYTGQCHPVESARLRYAMENSNITKSNTPIISNYTCLISMLIPYYE